VPKAEIAARGGATRVRTIRLPNDRYAHVYVVPKAGKRGGHTVMGEIHHRKGGGESKVKPDSQPAYRIKPQGVKRGHTTKKPFAGRR